MMKSIKLYQGRVFVEDSLRESQEIKNVSVLDNFDQIDFVTKERLIFPETAYNTL